MAFLWGSREEREVNIIQSFRLIKVFYLRSDGDLDFTWVTLGVEIPGQRVRGGWRCGNSVR